MDKEELEAQILKRRITRRQAVKAGGIAALGLAFSKPIISSLHPPSALAQVLTPGPTPPQPPEPCTAVITLVTISGPISVDTAVTPVPATRQYTSTVASSCGDCNVGNCDPVTTYLWEVSGGDFSIATPNAASTDITFKDDFTNYTLTLTVNITCGAGECQDTAGPVIDTHLVEVGQD
ncbi:MAG: hypothetical protein J4O09_14115 [Chloroflexi bacterium]|nr:hypothetical protein [Chloroflexota bacterium]